MFERCLLQHARRVFGRPNLQRAEWLPVDYGRRRVLDARRILGTVVSVRTSVTRPARFDVPERLAIAMSTWCQPVTPIR